MREKNTKSTSFVLDTNPQFQNQKINRKKMKMRKIK